MIGEGFSPSASSASTNISSDQRLRLVDVGGAGGLHGDWLGYADRITPILFEPNPLEAAALRGTLEGRFHGALVLETGLSNIIGPQDLNITRYWGCASLRQPNQEVLSRYRIAPLFEVTGHTPVACTRYDALYHAGQVPAPDAIKVDVQGYEYEVLQGFGGLLQTCLGIEIETHVYPIYRDQKLLQDLVLFLADFGFVLRKMTPVPSFDGDVVELDAWFTKDMQSWRSFDAVQKEKFRLICDVWGLVDYDRINPTAHHSQLAPAKEDISGRIIPQEIHPPRESEAAPTPRFAVLFKAHFWDEFVERQFRRLRERVGPGDVFVVVDETNGPVMGIRHDRILSMTERLAETDGYLLHPPGNLFWYNTDYQIYHFFDKYPDYKYVFICEYDCTVNIDIVSVIDRMEADGLGFVGERISSPASTWPWTATARPYYAANVEIVGRLVSCAAFSRAFAKNLQAARREHARRALAREVVTPVADVIIWPNNEAFIGAEIARLHVPELPLSAFGDTSHFDWRPAYAEIELPALSACALVHPVLDDQRYMRSLAAFNWNLEDLFRAGSPLRVRMERCDLTLVVSMFLRYFIEKRNWSAIEKLRQFAQERVGEEARAIFNVARGKPATQSSTSPWSRSPNVAEDAIGAVSGRVKRNFGFHTDQDDAPWWCVDLQTISPVREIHIYDRLGHAERSRSLMVSYSSDMVDWHDLYRHGGHIDAGVAGGAPLRIESPDPIALRFLRIHLAEPQVLHLDEVEIYV